MDNFKYVLYLFACAAKGEEAEIIKDIDIKDIYSISIKHGIWSIVFLSVKKLYKKDKTVFNLNDEIFNKLDFSFMQSITKSIMKWQRLPEILKNVYAAGIDVCLLKGLTLGVLYNEPYSRSTTDIDLLINPEDEEYVCKVFEAEGFNIMYRWEGSHHTKCTRGDIGLVEIHTQLYDKKVQALWFGMSKTQKYTYEDFEYEDLVCKQLNATDGLIFNFLHFVKHYIAGAITVKQLMDTMLYIKKYKENIDFDRFNNAISPLNYFELYKTFKCLAVKYLGFSPEELQEDSSLFNYSDKADYVLEDMNKFAGSDKASVYHTYNKRLYEKKKKLSGKGNDASRTKNIYQHIWMNEKRMKELYGAKYDKIYLKPFFQMHRILLRLLNIKKYIRKTSVAETKEMVEAKERISLLEKLGVL